MVKLIKIGTLFSIAAFAGAAIASTSTANNDKVIVIAQATTAPAAPAAAAAPAPAPAAATKVTYASDVMFANSYFSSKTMSAEEKAKLDNLVEKLSGISLEVIVVVGHSDDGGSEDTCLSMSEGRAEAVKEYLMTKGIEKNRIYTEGKGSKQPVADNKTEEGREKNNRVEVEVVGTRKN